jgi:hypothetical protein
MARLAVIFSVSVFCIAAIASTRAPESLAPQAIKAVIDEYFVANVHEIEIISFGERNGYANGVVDKFLRVGSHTMPIEVTRNSKVDLDSDWFKLNKSTILLFDSPENFNQIQPQIIFQCNHIIS